MYVHVLLNTIVLARPLPDCLFGIEIFFAIGLPSQLLCEALKFPFLWCSNLAFDHPLLPSFLPSFPPPFLPPLPPPPQYCSSVNQEWDIHIVQYYERLAGLQSQGETITPETMQALFSQIQTTHAPQSLFREWAEKSYTNPTDFWSFRMQVFLEYMLNPLSRISH